VSHVARGCTCLQHTNAAADSLMLQYTCDPILVTVKIEHKLQGASGWAPSTRQKPPGGRLVQGKGTQLSCGGRGPLILNLVTTWCVVVSFTPLPLYPWTKSP